MNTVLAPHPATAAQVYERIKAMATTFRLRPGERVNELELARRLGVSRTPVREALNRIAAEGFLQATPNRGYTVRPLDAQQLMALYEYRATVELGVVKLVCERASDQALADLASYVQGSRDEIETDAQALRLLSRDEAFHERLAVLSGNPEFVRSVRSLNERIRFPRWIDLKARRSHTRNDHPDIVRALQARDVAAAQAMMSQHIDKHLDHVVDLARAGFAEIYMGNALADYAESLFTQAAEPGLDRSL
ncbi:GntR family transcriptional regulator [Bordetella genomosp. 7]|jgi:DNA-binding GntR family transcriptional regulator|uniref:GntR family transcriptional regulator n=1 Tax=Bordetella genomosp. 7 TaxID=1416805 RepID=A0A261R0B3_9BORD|nr:GntR family transcriptional regulator [Bordetella genomosp. 7]OZI18177.1 GntR family transcriptional regulator [Bordetella genomosp. 7]OZI21972.1 GntR family transcriptional regulator [Bordetella genomosp. 7]